SASKTQPGLDSDEFDDGFELSSEGCLQPHQASGKLQLPLSSPMPPRTEGFGDGFGLSYQGHPKLRRSPGKMQIPSRSAKADTDDFEADFELPSDGLLKRRQPSNPLGALHQQDDIDLEWTEGSLGTRNAGTRRDGRSNRS